MTRKTTATTVVRENAARMRAELVRLVDEYGTAALIGELGTCLEQTTSGRPLRELGERMRDTACFLPYGDRDAIDDAVRTVLRVRGAR